MTRAHMDATGGVVWRCSRDKRWNTSQLFPPQQATGLTELLNNFRELEVQRAADTRELKQGLTALVECHVTLGGEVRRLAEKLEVVTATLGSREMLKVIVAMNIHPTAEQAAQETGVLLVPYSRINRERA